MARAGGESEGAFGRGATLPLKYWEQLHRPDARDPRGYILPPDQPDFTATRFIQALQKAGVVVHRATAAFTVAGKPYPAGSYVVKAAQAFRPHVRDMFEPQDHPNDFEYPGGPPNRPYDITGYTLAYQMGVRFDRILDGVRRALRKDRRPGENPGGSRRSGAQSRGLPVKPHLQRCLSRHRHAACLRRRSLLAQESRPAPSTFRRSPPPRHISQSWRLNSASASTPSRPNRQGEAFQLHPARIGLWDRYGGSMESGHIRWIFEQAYPVPYELVYAPALNAGNLKSKFDVLIFPDGGIPAEGGRGGRGGRGGNLAADAVPNEYRNQIGSVTAAQTIPPFAASWKKAAPS